jgi:hypothetical protein
MSAERAEAQSVSPFVVSTSGGFYSSSAGMLSFTTGEMTAVETYTSPVAILTQGFQQTFDIGTYITEHPNPYFAFGVYPNPSSGNFNLITETSIDEYISVRISDMLGREILSREFYQHASVNIEPFDLSIAAPGMYLITLTLQENPEYQFVLKIQVVR